MTPKKSPMRQPTYLRRLRSEQHQEIDRDGNEIAGFGILAVHVPFDFPLLRELLGLFALQPGTLFVRRLATRAVEAGRACTSQRHRARLASSLVSSPQRCQLREPSL